MKNHIQERNRQLDHDLEFWEAILHENEKIIIDIRNKHQEQGDN